MIQKIKTALKELSFIDDKTMKDILHTIENVFAEYEVMPKTANFKKYYDTKTKQNIWLLGYLGDTIINIQESYNFAKEFSASTGVNICSIGIVEIQKSRRFKYFKYIFSTQENQLPAEGSEQTEDVLTFFYD